MEAYPERCEPHGSFCSTRPNPSLLKELVGVHPPTTVANGAIVVVAYNDRWLVLLVVLSSLCRTTETRNLSVLGRTCMIALRLESKVLLIRDRTGWDAVVQTAGFAAAWHVDVLSRVDRNLSTKMMCGGGGGGSCWLVLDSPSF